MANRQNQAINQRKRKKNNANDKPAIVVDINNAEIDEMLLLAGFRLEFAQKIVKERITRYGFTSIEEISALLDLEPHIAERLRVQIMFKPFLGGKKTTTVSAKRIVDF